MSYELAVKFLRPPAGITPTRVELAARCYRRHCLSDLVHLKPLGDGKDPNLAFGDMAHQSTAVFWRECTDAEGWELGGSGRAMAYGKVMQFIGDTWPKVWEDVVAKTNQEYMTIELLGMLMEEYTKNARVGGDFPGHWRIVETEQRRKAELAGLIPLQVFYQIDRLIQNEEGDYGIFDTKTASSLSPMWRRTQEQSIQQRIYKALEEQRLGKEIRYSAIEGVAKKQAAGMIEYVWLNMNWDKDFVNEALLQAKSQASKDDRLLLQAHMDYSGDDPRLLWMAALNRILTDPTTVEFNTQDCQSFFKGCEYESLCFSNPSEREGIALGDFQLLVKDYRNV